MPALTIAGPSYALRNRSADVQRVVNWIPVQIESATGKGGQPSYLKQCPGKVALSAFGAPLRGIYTTRDVLYAVAGATLYSIDSSGVATSRGALSSSSGPVQIADNVTQLGIVDGPSGYVLDLDTMAFVGMSGNFRGSSQIDVLDGYGVFSVPNSPQFYISANQDFTGFNALEFATTESSIGNIVALCVKHRELILLKERTGEVWADSGGADFPLARNDGAALQVGCAAAQSLAVIDGAAVWLSRDESGGIGVSAMTAYQPQRISSHALEEALTPLTESQISGARAYAYRQEGLSYYALQVPGLATTWVYELRAGIWHERAEWVDGVHAQDLGMCHAYAYGRHFVGGSDGVVYALDPSANVSGSGPLMRERITPHNAVPALSRRRFGSMQIDCNTGAGLADGSAGSMLMRYSDDGGMTWGNWRTLSLGAIGRYTARARATMLGAARDRVWHIRVTDAVRCEPVSAIVDEV
jgi:hypothetical protein